MTCVVCLGAELYGCDTCRPESEREKHIRADERARVQAAIVAWLQTNRGVNWTTNLATVVESLIDGEWEVKR